MESICSLGKLRILWWLAISNKVVEDDDGNDWKLLREQGRGSKRRGHESHRKNRVRIAGKSGRPICWSSKPRPGTLQHTHNSIADDLIS